MATYNSGSNSGVGDRYSPGAQAESAETWIHNVDHVVTAVDADMRYVHGNHNTF